MKRFFSLALTIALLICTMSLGITTADANDGDYTIKPLSATTAELTGYIGSKNEISVPSIIAGYTIVKIGDNAFLQNKTLASVTVSEGVTEIGEAAFAGAFIKKVYLPNSVQSIGSSAFRGCIYLQEIRLSDELSYIPKSCFSNCTRLTSITVPEGVTEIADGAFESCTHLSDITLPNTLCSVGEYTFAYNYSLESIKLPNNLTSIGNYSFFYSTALSSIDIPPSVKSIGDWAFVYCSSLSDVTLHEGLRSVGANAFDSCPVKLVKVPSTVDSIGEYALGYSYDDELFDYVRTSDFKILCTDSSEALRYARENGFSFELYSVDQTDVTETASPEESTGITAATAAVITTAPTEASAVTSATETSAVTAATETSAATLPSETSSHTEPAVSTSTALATESTVMTDPTDAPEVTELLGDANLDGIVNIKDATAIQKHIAGLLGLDERALKLSDYNRDSAVNVKDATAIQKHIAGII